jgi:hypothetical protein
MNRPQSSAALRGRKAELERMASQLLRRHRYSADGRPLGQVSWPQRQFERRQVLTPSNGQPR